MRGAIHGKRNRTPQQAKQTTRQDGPDSINEAGMTDPSARLEPVINQPRPDSQNIKSERKVHLLSLYRHADVQHQWLLVIAVLFAVAAGVSLPLMTVS
jgi:hypothetical protein